MTRNPKTACKEHDIRTAGSSGYGSYFIFGESGFRLKTLRYVFVTENFVLFFCIPGSVRRNYMILSRAGAHVTKIMGSRSDD
jgi:hypothetical protein